MTRLMTEWVTTRHNNMNNCLDHISDGINDDNANGNDNPITNSYNISNIMITQVTKQHRRY